VQDENALVEAARTDRRAFGELYDRYFDATYNYIYRRVGDHEAAEDLTSATWERALGAVARYETRGLPFAAWLFRIAGNLVSNYHRERQSRRVVPWEAVASGTAGAGPRDAHSESDDRELVRAVLASLAPGDREVLSLCYFGGLSAEQLGATLGCSAVAANKRLQRARSRFGAQLEALSRVDKRRATDDE
jgi:RNA polymerase sigma-70 factor (ECF subfamily)